METKVLSFDDGVTVTGVGAGAMTFGAISTPSTPSAGNFKIYFKTDGAYYLDENGIEQQVGSGSGSGSGINYIYNANATVNTEGWGSSDWDYLTITRNTTTPIRNDADFLISKTASNENGDYITGDFTIDDADKAKMLTVSFDYLTSINYVDDYLICEIDDVSNGTTIECVPKYIKKTGSLAEKFTCEFQAAYNGGTYGLRFKVNTTTTTAWTMNFTNVSVGPKEVQYGSPMTDWVSFTPTTIGFTATGASGKWRRVGDSMELQYKLDSFSSVSGTLGVNMPSGYSIDVSKQPETTYNIVGNCFAFDASTATSYHGSVLNPGATAFWFYNHASAAQYTATSPFTWTTSDELRFIVKVPILGWSASTIMSSEADTRVCAFEARGFNSAPTVINTASALIFNAAIYDTHGAYNSTTGEYTVKVAGAYRISSTLEFTAAAYTAGGRGYIHAVKNGTTYTQLDRRVVDTTTNQSLTLSGTALLPNLVVGDVIKINAAVTTTNTTTTTAMANTFSIERLSGPTQIAAESTVFAEYSTNAGQGFTTATTTILDFEDKVIDTHGAVTTGTYWKFTAPRTGYYIGTFQFLFNSTGAFSGSEVVDIALYRDGVSNRGLAYDFPKSTEPYSRMGRTFEIYLKQGQYIDIRVSQHSGGDLFLNANSIWNWISIYSK
jgi:hypothetical protein